MWRKNIFRLDDEDLFVFAQQNKGKFVSVVKGEMLRWNMAKGQFGLLIRFGSRRRFVDHYFYNDPKVLQHANDAVHKSVRDQFRYFIDWVNSRINNFTLNSDLKFYKVLNKAYVNASRFVPLVAGSYIRLPKKLQDKKAIINVDNRKDNECLEWAPRVALSAVPNGKASSCPISDGIDYAGISFPTPLQDIDKLDAQNE